MKQVLTDEEKKARAAKMRAAKEAKRTAQEAVETKSNETTPAANEKPAEVNTEPKTGYSADEVQKMIAEAVAQAMAQKQTPQIVTIASNTEMVHFLWQAEVADNNIVEFGEHGMYGQITGKTGSFYVPKADLSRVLTERNRYFLNQRWLIVVSGLSDDERKALGVDYKPGEVLDKAAFEKIVELGDEILDIYPDLCEGHKIMVAEEYAEAYAKGSPFVTRERVVALNNLSKREGREKGDFTAIIEAMNAKDMA